VCGDAPNAGVRPTEVSGQFNTRHVSGNSGLASAIYKQRKV